MMRYALILPLLAAGPSGCRQGDESARNEVLEAVERYNGNLRRAYLEVNLDYLAGVAMEKQMSRIYPALEALRASGNTMIALQCNFQVRERHGAGWTGIRRDQGGMGVLVAEGAGREHDASPEKSGIHYPV
jgi:hypothetical protein